MTVTERDLYTLHRNARLDAIRLGYAKPLDPRRRLGNAIEARLVDRLAEMGYDAYLTSRAERVRAKRCPQRVPLGKDDQPHGDPALARALPSVCPQSSGCCCPMLHKPFLQLVYHTDVSHRQPTKCGDLEP